jgi:hypothetical protein
MPGVSDAGISVIRIYIAGHWKRKKGNETLYCSAKCTLWHKFLTRGKDHEYVEHVIIQLTQIQIM